MKCLLLLLAATALAQQPDTRVLVAYHSETGNTAKLAEAVRAGAASVDHITVTLRKAADVQDSDSGGGVTLSLNGATHRIQSKRPASYAINSGGIQQIDFAGPNCP